LVNDPDVQAQTSWFVKGASTLALGVLTNAPLRVADHPPVSPPYLFRQPLRAPSVSFVTITATGLATASPVIPVGGFTQKHTLGPTSYADSAPIIGVPLAEILKPVSLVDSSPVIGSRKLFIESASFVLGSDVLDKGLTELLACNKMLICPDRPADYSAATSTALGHKDITVFGSPGAISDGRSATSTAITNGVIDANGDVNAWAAVDTNTSRLLASGYIATPMHVDTTLAWSLPAIIVHLPRS